MWSGVKLSKRGAKEWRSVIAMGVRAMEDVGLGGRETGRLKVAEEGREEKEKSERCAVDEEAMNLRRSSAAMTAAVATYDSSREQLKRGSGGTAESRDGGKRRRTCCRSRSCR